MKLPRVVEDWRMPVYWMMTAAPLWLILMAGAGPVLMDEYVLSKAASNGSFTKCLAPKASMEEKTIL